MPTLYQSDHAKGIIGTPYPDCAGDVVAVRASIAVPNTLAANDILEMLQVPAGTKPILVVLDSDDLDTNGTPTITLDVGFMSGTPGDNDSARTVAAEFFSGSTVAQAGGVVYPSLKTAVRQAVSDSVRALGIKVAAAGATKAAGTIGLTAYFVTE